MTRVSSSVVTAGVLVAGALLAAGCAVATPLPPATGKVRAAPVLPVDFETHLTVSRHCKRLGITSTNLTEGNLVLSFVESSSTSTNTVNGVGQTTMTSGFTWVAYRCPKDVLTSIMAAEDEASDDADPEGATSKEAGDGDAGGGETARGAR